MTLKFDWDHFRQEPEYQEDFDQGRSWTYGYIVEARNGPLDNDVELIVPTEDMAHHVIKQLNLINDYTHVSISLIVFRAEEGSEPIEVVK